MTLKSGIVFCDFCHIESSDHYHIELIVNRMGVEDRETTAHWQDICKFCIQQVKLLSIMNWR